MSEPAPIVLVHGLWLNGSTWQHVTPTLEAAGHRVSALTLPGMAGQGADRTGITLTDHVAAVVAAIDAADAPVLLVGHSAGCGIAHAAVDARPDKVARVVHVGGFPGPDGEALLAGLPARDGAVPMPDWAEVGEEANIVDLDPEQLAALYADAIPVPEHVMTEPVRLHDERRYAVPVTMVCPEYTAADLRAWVADGQVDELAKITSVEYVDLPGGHWPQITQPDALAEVILDAAVLDGGPPVTVVHELTAQQARRIAVRAQLLEADRPTDLPQVVRRLALLQADQTAAVAPSAELVLWSRLGSEHRRGDLDVALAGGTVVEVQGMIRPAEDVALFTAEMAAWPTLDWQVPAAEWLAANDDARRDVLAKLYDDGPLPASAVPDTTVLPWQSGGWNNNRNLRMLLERMVERGEIAAAGRDGRERLWDLAERVYPEAEPVPLAEAHRIVAERRLAALGIARAKAPKTPAEPNDVGQVGEQATVEGVRGRWQVDPAYLVEDFAERAAVLSPLDRLVFDRQRMAELFAFDYQLEMYKPAARRRWGYWAMPILYGDRLVGKVDAAADRDAGVLRVNAVHEDVRFTRTMRTMINNEIDALATWLELTLEGP